MRSLIATLISATLLCLLCGSTSAFVTPSSQIAGQNTRLTRTASPVKVSTTQLQERQWNFNEGQGPFGMKKNAETWNGRVAQMAFVVIFIQELIQGKGVIQGFRDGDPVNVAGFAGFVVVTLGLTAFLAFKGKTDYVDEELKNP